jgi:hypothetical protein
MLLLEQRSLEQILFHAHVIKASFVGINVLLFKSDWGAYLGSFCIFHLFYLTLPFYKNGSVKLEQNGVLTFVVRANVVETIAAEKTLFEQMLQEKCCLNKCCSSNCRSNT